MRHYLLEDCALYGNSRYGLNSPDDHYALRMRLYLQGAYDASNRNMTTLLQAKHLLPSVSPYAQDPRVVSRIPSNAVTDWVFLQLQRLPDGAVFLAKSLFLRSDGFLTDETGAPAVDLEGFVPDAYRVSIQHRNHLAVVSSSPSVLTNIVTALDFTTDPNGFLGGTNACVELEPGVWGMLGGDADGDGRITPVDRQIVEKQMGKTGYLSGDLNLDGVVDGRD